MRGYHYGDNRGARLAVDDREGAFALYGGNLDAPSDVQATVVGRTAVTLEWTDNSRDEEVFLVQRKKGKKRSVVATAARDATMAAVTGLRPNSPVTLRVVAALGEIQRASPELTTRTTR